MTPQELNTHFTTLRENYRSVNVLVFDDCMVYSKVDNPKRTAEKINKIIQELNLPLIAVSNENNGLFSGTVRIEPKL